MIHSRVWGGRRRRRNQQGKKNISEKKGVGVGTLLKFLGKKKE